MASLRSVLTFSFLVICINLHAQQRCATVEYQKIKRTTGKVTETDKQFEQALAEKIRARKRNRLNNSTTGLPYRIPVVVHIIHNGEAEGSGRNISDAQIISQIDVLNKDFNRLNNDASNTPAMFAGVAGTLNIEFVLAKQDSLGNCTNGIVRVDGNRAQWTLGREAEFKALSYWPAEDYLNIWVIDFAGFIGYAQFPVSSGLPGLEEDDNRKTDGIIVDYRAFGTVDAGPFDLDPQYNKGRSTTHEVGHFLGLRHVWGDEDTGQNVCAESDYADDTPNQADATFDTPTHPLEDDCSPAIMFQNFMDYTDDISMNLFTLDQVDRMVTVLANSPRRASLLTSNGLEEPDTQDLIDLELTSLDLPQIITCNNRNNRSLLVANITNLTGAPVDEIKYLLWVNQDFVSQGEQTIPFINSQAVLNLALIPGLILGENTITVSITGGCDPNSANNTLTIPVMLVDSDCTPFAIYMQDNGQAVITFDLPEETSASVSILTMTGQQVSTTAIARASNQTFPLVVNEGAYIIRVQAGSLYYSTKVILHR